MSIAWPTCEVFSPKVYSNPSSYTGPLFHDLCAWRDQKGEKSDGILLRVSSEVAFIALTVASLVEFMARAIFEAFSYFFCSYSQMTLASHAVEYVALTFLASANAVACNLFAKNVSSAIKSSFSHALRIRSLALPLFPLNSFDNRLIEIKLLSHWLELQGNVKIEGEKVKLEGALPNWMFPSVANSLAAFYNSKEFQPFSLPREKAELLKEGLEDFAIAPSFADKVRSKQLCFLQSGWEGHAICICFFNGYMAIGNRGAGSEKNSTLKVYKIDPSLVNEQMIYEIHTQKRTSIENATHYFYQTLPNQLSPTREKQQDALCDLFKNIQPMYAPVGNCALSSIQATLPFAWALLLDPQPTEEVVRKAELESLVFQNWASIRYADLFLPNNQFYDPEFLTYVSRAKKIKTIFLEHLKKILTHPLFKNDLARSRNYLKGLHYFNYLNHCTDGSKVEKPKINAEMEKIRDQFNGLFLKSA